MTCVRMSWVFPGSQNLIQSPALSPWTVLPCAITPAPPVPDGRLAHLQPRGYKGWGNSYRWGNGVELSFLFLFVAGGEARRGKAHFGKNMGPVGKSPAGPLFFWKSRDQPMPGITPRYGGEPLKKCPDAESPRQHCFGPCPTGRRLGRRHQLP